MRILQKECPKLIISNNFENNVLELIKSDDLVLDNLIKNLKFDE